MDPIAALSEIAFWMERGRGETRRVEAYRKAAWALAALPAEELDARIAAKTLTEIANVGPSTSAVVMEASTGVVPKKLADLRSKGDQPLAEADANSGHGCAATCTRTPTGPMAARRSRRWWPPLGGSATSTSR